MARSDVGAHRSRRRVALLASAVVLPLAGPLGGALVGTAAADSSTQVPDSAEAWYASAPIDVCSTPLGCPPTQPPTASPYPAGSLHVGVAGGQETARSYLQPALMSLPPGATLLSGTMTLHVDTSNTDGSLTPENAKILACLVTAPFADGTAGSTSAPPAVDCTVSDKPTYVAATGVLTLDLAPFLQAWDGGAPQLGIALVPNKNQVAQTDAWHVTIEGRKQAGAKPVTSTIAYREAPAGSLDQSFPSGPVTLPAASPPAPVSLPPTTTSVAPAASPPVVAPTTPAPLAQRRAAFSGPVTYTAAYLAPLALFAGVWFFARLFTRDATPKRMWV